MPSSPPIFYIRTGLYLVLNVVGQGGEEVEASDALHLVNGVVVQVLLLVALRIPDDEAKGFGFARQAQYHFEERLGYHHSIRADGLMVTLHEHRAADDIHFAIPPGPLATIHLNAVPQPAVQLRVLRTDVHQAERLGHRLPVPLVVACRTHVTT